MTDYLNDDIPMEGEGAPAIEPVKNRKRKNKLALAAEREITDFQTTLSTGAGRHAIWSILEQCGGFRSGMAPNAHDMAFACGMREVGVRIYNQIRLADQDGKAYALMQREAADRAKLVA